MLCLTLKRKKELEYNKWWTHREYGYKTQLLYYILSTQVFSYFAYKRKHYCLAVIYWYLMIMYYAVSQLKYIDLFSS